MIEVFKSITGYEGLYEVSNLGNVRSLGSLKGNGKGYFQEGRVLKPAKNTFGYLFVDLCKNGNEKLHTVHRLVATAFIENPDNLPCINHKDEDKTNNVVSNLEWCSYSYNINYGTHNQRVSESQRNNPKLSKKVLQLTLDGVLVREWESVNECHRNGFDKGHVSACCLGKSKTHKGYRWCYVD